MSWSHLQGVSAIVTTAGTAVPVTMASNLTSGSKLICYVFLDTGTGSTVSGVADGNGNSFTQLTHFTFNTTTFTDIWVLDTPAGDVGTKPTITATMSVSVGGTVIIVQEVSGLATGTTTAACYDGTAGTASAAAAASPAPLPVYASTASNEFLVNVLNDDFGGLTTWVAPSGYAGNDTLQNAGGTAGVAYKNSTGGTEAGQWSWTGGGTDSTGVVLVAFKLAAAPAGRQSQPIVSRAAVQRAASW